MEISRLKKKTGKFNRCFFSSSIGVENEFIPDSQNKIINTTTTFLTLSCEERTETLTHRMVLTTVN